MSHLSIKLFGSIDIAYAETPLSNLTSPKIHALLAYLAVEPEQAYPRAELAELLWPERSPGIALQNLRQTLTRLNRSLTATAPDLELLTVTRQTIQMNHGAPEIDARTFEALIAEVYAHTHREKHLCQFCCEKLVQVVRHYQGDFLATLSTDSPAFDEWMAPKQTWFRREALSALSTLTRHHLANQDAESAYQYAWQQVEIDPLNEEGHRQVMRTLALAGRKEEAFAQYERCRVLIRAELGVELAPETTALWEEIQQGGPTEPLETALPSIGPHNTMQDTRRPALHNIPAPATAFVGREGELVDLADLLNNPDCRLVTLLGHGGIGKTRLAIEVAQRNVSKFKHGAAFVELATVTSAELVPSAIATALGYSFSNQVDSVDEQRSELLAYLADQECLIVLDNLEQLLHSDPGPHHAHEAHAEPLLTLISDMLQVAPNSMIMVTSRQPLHLRSEWIFDVEGLNYPALDNQTALVETGWEQFESMQFFVKSTQRISRRFTPTSEDAQAIAQICQIVEGTPLALELAAGWGRRLSCPRIFDRIVESLDFLSTSMVDVPERHRSIRAVFESTWSQLSPPQRHSCARLSILRGPFSEAAALTVAQADQTLLTALTDRSLLRRGTPFHGEERYEMHELLRQYASEKLLSLPALLAETEQSYAAYYAAFVKSQEPALEGAELSVGVQLIHEQIANIRQAWQHCVKTSSISHLGQFAGGLLRYYNMTNQTEEAITNFGDGVAAARLQQRGAPTQVENGRDESLHVLAQLLACRARACYKVARYTEAITDAEEAQRLGGQSGNERAEVLGALYWGISLINQGKHDAAHEKLSETLTLARRIDWTKIESDSIRGLGILAQQAGDIDAAQSYYEESLAIGQQINDARGTSACLGNLGNICRQKGDFEQAQRYMAESLAVHQQIGDRSSEARTISMLGDLAMDLEEYSEAESCFQQAYDILTKIGEHHYAADALVSLGECYARLGEAERATPLWERALAQYQSAGEMDQVEMVTRYLEQQLLARGAALAKR